MREITEITGFIGRGKVRVFSEDGRPFYFFNGRENFAFNLPPGRYKFEGEISKRKEPVKYKLPKLPRPERIIPQPEKITLFFGENPNKCSIVLEKGVILCDTSLERIPIPSLTFVFFHEIGHYHYRSEDKCDTFAAYHMLKRGFNPSQIAEAPRITLSYAAGDRVSKCEHHAKNAK